MKKVFFILSAVLLIATTACQKENEFASGKRTTTVPPKEGTLVEVNFNVDCPNNQPGTRASMEEAVQIGKLYIAVFSEDNGYLQNWIPCTFVKNETAEPGMKVTYTYKAYLPLTDNTVFHFIADPPVDQPVFDYENKFIRTMVTSGSTGAYWQRIIISGGVQAAKNERGEYILDGDGNYTVDLNSIAPMQHVVMIRNFAKIEVTDIDERFDVTQWALVNVPTSGTVAPWNRKETGEGEDAHTIGFDIPYTSIKEYLPETSTGTGLQKLGKFYEDLTQKELTGYKGYVGTMPDGVEFDGAMPTVFKSASDTDQGLYMFERPIPDTEQDPTMVLVEVEWVDADYPGKSSGLGTKQWYKIELLDNEGEYMPILRHIVYHFSLSGLTESGYATAQAAYDANAFGNVSSSLETSMLNELVVGDTKLVVDHLDFSFYNGEETAEIEFQFWPSLSGSPVFNTVTSEDEEENITIKIYSKQVDNYENAPALASDINLSGVTTTRTIGGQQWGIIPITLNAPLEDGGMRKSKIRIQGAYGLNRAIYREVMITVMGKQSFDPEITKDEISITDAVNQPVTIPIGLPAGLGASMFPIQIAIEAENNCLSTTKTELPVKDGVSIFESTESETKAGKNTFYYIRTIEYSEYHPVGATEDKTVYNCEFTTTKSSGNSTQIKLKDLTDKFNSKIITLTAN